MKILGNRIAISVIKPTSDSAIQLPDSALPQPDRGVVVYVGSGKKVPKQIVAGATVHFDNRFGCVDVIERSKPLKIISTEDVLAIL